jgi:GDP/UDP-N,N'-diacetylbacillosamine 2-epimerase (hydrolysing)
MKKVKNICVITGSRAEYSLLRPVMRAIQQQKGLRLFVIVTGSHLFAGAGMTVNEIIKDGFSINARVKMTPAKDTPQAMAESIGQGVTGISKALTKIQPDMVVVLGDRVEALAGAIATVYSKIVLAHIHGGDSPKAGFDEYARHAITKLAHVHFPATPKSAERIKKMGEDPRKIYTVGAPGVDNVFDGTATSRKDLEKKYKIDFSKTTLLVVQHPLSTSDSSAAEEMKQTLEAACSLNYQAVVLYPNIDAGGRRMAAVIERYRKYPGLMVLKNMPPQDYIGLLKVVRVMVGNSSSGIIEAPAVHLPVVNIGSRQDGRERAENVIDVPPDRMKIQKAIQKALTDKYFKKKVLHGKNPYGRGNAGVKIAKILASLPMDERLFQKKLTY